MGEEAFEADEAEGVDDEIQTDGADEPEESDGDDAE